MIETLQPVSDVPVSLSESVYETLLEGIIAGRLSSGTVLSEIPVARQLEVSRTPVHDALKQLAQDGFVEREAGRRARVAEFTRDDLFEIFEMRKFLEGPAAELAGGHMDVRQLGPLRQTADQLKDSMNTADWLARWVNFDDEFHHAIALASGNARLCRDIDRYRLLHRGFNRLIADSSLLNQALVEHERILSALENRDGASARSEMESHISTWQDYFVRAFPR